MAERVPSPESNIEQPYLPHTYDPPLPPPHDVGPDDFPQVRRSRPLLCCNPVTYDLPRHLESAHSCGRPALTSPHSPLRLGQSHSYSRPHGIRELNGIQTQAALSALDAPTTYQTTRAFYIAQPRREFLSPCISLYLAISLYLLVSPYISLYLPPSPCISLYLPISPCISGISLYLPEYPCISLHLPASPCISLPDSTL